MKTLLTLSLIALLLGCDQNAILPETETSACHPEAPMEMRWLQEITSKAEADPGSTLYLSKIYQYKFRSGYVFHLLRMASSFYPEVVDCSGQAVKIFNEQGEIADQELFDLVTSESGKVIWQINS